MYEADSIGGMPGFPTGLKSSRRPKLLCAFGGRLPLLPARKLYIDQAPAVPPGGIPYFSAAPFRPNLREVLPAETPAQVPLLRSMA